jgi:hypothetical protein
MIGRGRVSPRRDLHVAGCRFRVACAFVLDYELFDDACQKANARLPLTRPDEDGAVDLVEDRRGALRW